MKDELIDELRRLVSELEQAEKLRMQQEESCLQDEVKYRKLFDTIAVSVIEVDWGDLRTLLEDLVAGGVQDLHAHISRHPGLAETVLNAMRVSDVNKHCVSMFSATSRDQLVGPAGGLLRSLSLESVAGLAKAISDDTEIFEFETSVESFDHRNIHLLVRVSLPGLSSGSNRLTIAAIDITEIKRREEALLQSEENLRAIIQSAKDCVYVKDRNLRFRHVNPALEKLLGRPASELIGLKDEDLYGKEAGKRTKETDMRVLSGQKVEETQTRPVNGRLVTFHDVRVPVRGADGDIIGICGISRNISDPVVPEPILGDELPEYSSPAMRSTLAKALQASAADSVVLLQGESGSGKDFMARFIHANSARSKGPFFEVNCAALAHELAESELFGHEPGAFTGARKRKRGLLELAENGTLLLNEIGELSLAIQSKLLTFLDSKSFTRVGGERKVRVNARLIAATHRDLKTEVVAGRFLQPLFYRLDVFCIHVPPLRDRVEDMPVLVHELLAQLGVEMHLTEVPAPDRTMLSAMMRYQWPGNVRELRNVLERALIQSGGGSLHLDIPVPEYATGDWWADLSFPADINLYLIRDQITQCVCMEALRRAGGNKKEAANLLGVSRFSFYRYLKYYSLENDEVTET